jgi:hypothetical protein
MSAVTYRGCYTPTADTAAAPRKKGLLARFLDNLIEARMRQAAREVERHLNYLPEDLRRRYQRTAEDGQQELPFGG